MVDCLTETEHRQFQTAQERGYLVCARKQRTLLDKYSQVCGQQGRPVLHLDGLGGHYQLVLHWPRQASPLSSQQRQQLKALLTPSPPGPGLLPIVFPGGAYSSLLEREAAEPLARKLSDWIEEQLRLPLGPPCSDDLEGAGRLPLGPPCPDDLGGAGRLPLGPPCS